jgi:hypothetical protein
MKDEHIAGLPATSVKEKRTIVKNAIRCKRCNVILESKFRHDFQLCKCPDPVGVDGGIDYLRRIGKAENMEELSEIKKEINYSEFRKDMAEKGYVI